jgi:IclR family transcriptional regulator, acetate operon repressor
MTATVPGEPTPATSPYTVASVARALTVVDLVAAGPPEGLTLAEVTRGLGTSKSTAYGLLQTLVGAGYLREVTPGPRYTLGMTLVRLGDLATRAQPLGGVVLPVLADLSRATGLTTRAAVAEDGFPVFIARIDAPGAIRFHTPLGVRELPHTSSAGKAILASLDPSVTERVIAQTGLPRRTRHTLTTPDELAADLERCRRRGYAVDDEEDVDGVFCVAAPFFDHAGRCAGAVSATGIKSDADEGRLTALGAAVVAAADTVTTLIGGRRADAAAPATNTNGRDG